jgi:lipoprotein-releasing system permease protein
MFELSVAWKYLLPRRRQLSVSVISLISIFVIALVVWLVVLFFSITSGMERHWISKLIAVTAPVRITPTPAYYDSYYYQIDGLSANAEYAHKSIGQKLQASPTDPYDPQSDEELPATWPKPQLTPDGQLRDLVKETFGAVESLQGDFPGLRAADYEAAFGNIRLRLLRSENFDADHQAVLAQAAIFGSLDPQQKVLPHALLPLRGVDVDNVLSMMTLGTLNNRDDGPAVVPTELGADFRERLRTFFDTVSITGLRVPEKGWPLPRALLPREGSFEVFVTTEADLPLQIVIPQRTGDAPVDASMQRGILRIHNGQLTLSVEQAAPQILPPRTRLLVSASTVLQAQLKKPSLTTARRPGDLQFRVSVDLQGNRLSGTVRLHGLQVDTFETQTQFAKAPEAPPAWIHRVGSALVLPNQPLVGDAVLLPKPFQDVGILVGDRGYLSYQSPSISTMQEQRVPVYVAGFYDPGIIPVGGKFVLVNRELTSLIRSAYEQEDSAITNGINVHMDDFRQAEAVKKALAQELERRGLAAYWKVETFRHYEFTKELLQQLRSDKNLSMVIASVIILVACSNIVSMLVILVNDKKLEIGILRSMGAPAVSIALIFGLCGVVMGLLGSFLGAMAALLTLRHIDGLVGLLERLQGYEIFNPTFYGNTMPNEVSWEGLIFVLLTTTLISVLAGIVPAVKASLLRPASILRSE